MIIPVEKLTLEQARAEIEMQMAKPKLAGWVANRIQQLTYRIHELDDSENEIIKLQNNDT